MVIEEHYLLSAGAEIIEYMPQEFIIHEGNLSSYYYQIIEGQIKLNNITEDGKEFIHNILSEGQCFGDNVLFLKQPYPMNAVALTACKIMKVCKQNFFAMLDVYPKLYQNLCLAMSHRVCCTLTMPHQYSAVTPSTDY